MPHKRSYASADYRRHRGATRRAGLPDPPPIPAELQRLPEEAFLRPRSKAVLKPRPKWRSRSDSPNWSSSEAARPAKRARVGRTASSQSAVAAEQLWARAASVGAPALPQPAAKTEIIESIPLPEQVSREIDEIFRVKRERERVKREAKSEVKQEVEPISLLTVLAQPVSVARPASPSSDAGTFVSTRSSDRKDSTEVASDTELSEQFPGTPVTIPTKRSPLATPGATSSSSEDDDESAASGRVDGKAKSAVGATHAR